MKDELTANFKKDLQRLIDKECWGIVEGKGTGSIVNFKFGAKIPLDEPIDNVHLSYELNNFESEFSLFISCVWRVDSSTKVHFGAWTEHEFVRQGTEQIIGQTIKSLELSEPAFDLKVTFSNDVSLNIFCDQTNEEDSNDNYDFFTPEIIHTVGHKSILTISEHD